jgi:hypothetical protein
MIYAADLSLGFLTPYCRSESFELVPGSMFADFSVYRQKPAAQLHGITSHKTELNTVLGCIEDCHSKDIHCWIEIL